MGGSDLLFSVVRAVHIGAAMLLVAFPLFALFHERERGTACGRAALGWLLAVEMASAAAWLWLATLDMSGGASWTDVGTVLTRTRFGSLWVLRGFLSLSLASLLLAVGRRTEKRRLALWLALVLGGALEASLAWAGHAASGVRWVAWHLTVDVVHLLAAAVWPAGLVPLVVFLARRRHEMAGTDVAVVRRFSRASFFAVLALVASGVANSWLMLPSWSALVDSFYGQLLLAKVTIVAVMIALGALNRYRFLPSLAVDSSPRLARIVAMENVLAVAVLLIVGVMGMTAPPS